MQIVLPPLGIGLLAVSLGLTAVLFVAGLLRLATVKGKPGPHVLMLCCALSSLACLYAFPVRRISLQFITTLLVPAVLVGAIGCQAAVARLWNRGKLAIILLLAINSFTSAVLLRASIGAVSRGEHRTDRDLLAAYQWLQDHSQPREVVLASIENSNRIPRYTHNTVFCGYAFSTVRYKEKAALLQQFFLQGTPDAWRQTLLSEYHVSYVLVGSHGALPRTEVFRNPAAAICKPWGGLSGRAGLQPGPDRPLPSPALAPSPPKR